VKRASFIKFVQTNFHMECGYTALSCMFHVLQLQSCDYTVMQVCSDQFLFISVWCLQS